MIAEDLLERGLADAAREYDVPDDAIDRLRAQLAVTLDDEPSWRDWRPPRPSKRGWLIMAAAAVVLLVAIPFAVGGGNNTTKVQPANRADVPAAVFHGAPGSTTAGAGTAGGSGAAHKAARAPLAAPAPQVAPSESGFAALTGTSAGTTTFDSTRALPPVPTVPTRIIKTGTLDLQVAKGKVTTTLDALTAIASIERGYIADSRTSEGSFAPSGQVTLRVPVGNFESTVSRARKIDGVKVLAFESAAKDVTSKYVDLTARLKALKDTRDTFLTLLSRANTIGETLAVQQHVTDVQTQIEQLQGQLKVLNNQAALSTLTVTVDQKVVTKATPTHHKSGFHKAVDRSVSRFVHGVEAIIGVIGPVLLAVLLLGLFWLAGRFGYRLLRRRMV